MVGAERVVREDARLRIDRHGEAQYSKSSRVEQRAGRRAFAVLRSARVNPPRLVLNASVAGLYGALLLAAFLRLLHPGPRPADWLVGLLPVVLVYTLASALLWPALYGAVRFFASHSLRVPWLSARYVMAFHVANGGLILAALLDTLWRDRKVIAPGPGMQLKVLGAAVAGAWVYAAAVSFVPPLKRSHAVQASAAGLSLAALLVPMVTRAPAEVEAVPPSAGAPAISPMTSRLILIDLDGADLEDILTLMSAGKLPAFSRLRREGSYGRLQAFVPCAGAVARTTLATGRLPYRSGVRGAWARDMLGRPLGIQVVPAGIGFDLLLEPFLSRRALTIDDRTGPAIWDIAAIAGGRSNSAGWNVVLDLSGPPPQPSRELRRRLVSDFLEGESPVGEAAGDLLAELGRAVGADESVARSLAGTARTPGVTALAFPGIDRVAHRFLRYARPEEFGNVSNSEIEIWGHVMERYYARLDGYLGRALEARGNDGWLFVASAHGMEPAPLRRRLAAALIGREATAGYHDQAPPGFLFALGPGVHAGQPFGRASIADVVPTALYVLGLPIARDLDGSIVEQVMGAGEVLDRPAIVIDTYGPRP
jgi:hypothetical protein